MLEEVRARLGDGPGEDGRTAGTENKGFDRARRELVDAVQMTVFELDRMVA